MIDDRRRTNLKYFKYQLPMKPSITMITPEINIIKIKRTFDKKLISASSNPIFDLGILEFICALVSFPV